MTNRKNSILKKLGMTKHAGLIEDLHFNTQKKPDKPLSEMAVLTGATGFSTQLDLPDLLNEFKKKNVPLLAMPGPAGITIEKWHHIPYLRLHGQRLPFHPLINPISSYKWLRAYTTGTGTGSVEKNVEAAADIIAALVTEDYLANDATLKMAGHSRGAVITYELTQELNTRKQTQSLKFILELNEPVPGGFPGLAHGLPPKLLKSPKKGKSSAKGNNKETSTTYKSLHPLVTQTSTNTFLPNVKKVAVRYAVSERLGIFGPQLYSKNDSNDDRLKTTFTTGCHEIFNLPCFSRAQNPYQLAELERKQLFELGDNDDGSLSQQQQNELKTLQNLLNANLVEFLEEKTKKLETLNKKFQTNEDAKKTPPYFALAKLWSQGRLRLYKEAAQSLLTENNAHPSQQTLRQLITTVDDLNERIEVFKETRKTSAKPNETFYSVKTKYCKVKYATIKYGALCGTYLPLGLPALGARLVKESTEAVVNEPVTANKIPLISSVAASTILGFVIFAPLTFLTLHAVWEKQRKLRGIKKQTTALRSY